MSAGTMAAPAPEHHGKASSGGPLILASSKTVVEIDAGKVGGYLNRGAWVFRGIPYAEPSGGANRFLPAGKAKLWAGVRSCLTYGPACPSGIGVSEGGDNSPLGQEVVAAAPGVAAAVHKES
jgi:para-nitrobenzyl esterase